MNKPKKDKSQNSANDTLKSMLAKAGGGVHGAADAAANPKSASMRDLAKARDPFGGDARPKGKGSRQGGLSAPRQRKSG